jgi:hypothetical protein
MEFKIKIDLGTSQFEIKIDLVRKQFQFQILYMSNIPIFLFNIRKLQQAYSLLPLTMFIIVSLCYCYISTS